MVGFREWGTFKFGIREGYSLIDGRVDQAVGMILTRWGTEEICEDPRVDVDDNANPKRQEEMHRARDEGNMRENMT